MAETPMQGLAEWLRTMSTWLHNSAQGNGSEELNRWASEVEAARASLPAPLPDSEELREWERIAVERAADFGAALYVKVAQVTPEERVRRARDALLAHLRARHGADTDRLVSNEKESGGPQ